MQAHQFMDYEELYDHNVIKNMKRYADPGYTRRYESGIDLNYGTPANLNPSKYSPNATYLPEGMPQLRYAEPAKVERASGIVGCPENMVNELVLEKIRSTTITNYYLLLILIVLIVLIGVGIILNTGFSIAQRTRQTL